MDSQHAAGEMLHTTVRRALRLHARRPAPALDLGPRRRMLVIGSGNALPTGRFLFCDRDAMFADEGEYADALQRAPGIEQAVVISASGTRHAPLILTDLASAEKEVWLLTCQEASPAVEAMRATPERVIVTPSRPEPPTYNTSTYLGMLFTREEEDPRAILRHIEQRLPGIPGFPFERYRAFYLMVEPQFAAACPMFVTKFDELFGPHLLGRSYTTETTRHAKNVVLSKDELFISLGCENTLFGHPEARLHVPLPAGAGPAAAMAVGYYVIGWIQERFHPWFWQHLAGYKDRQRYYLQ